MTSTDPAELFYQVTTVLNVNDRFFNAVYFGGGMIAALVVRRRYPRAAWLVFAACLLALAAQVLSEVVYFSPLAPGDPAYEAVTLGDDLLYPARWALLVVALATVLRRRRRPSTPGAAPPSPQVPRSVPPPAPPAPDWRRR